jgi:Tfp pilus assembly protein PilE
MTTFVAIAIVLAIIGILIYYVRSATRGEIEKASQDRSQEAQDEKIRLLEEQALRDEAVRRSQEAKNVPSDTLPKSDERFVHQDPNSGDYN